MFGCAHENENAQIKPPIQAKHQSSDHHTHHFTDHPKISISTSTDTSIPQTTNPKNTKPENAHSINHLLLENPKTKLKQKLSTMHTPKPTKKNFKNSYMTMTLKMEVLSYKSLIMCEFNCFVYPLKHWK